MKLVVVVALLLLVCCSLADAQRRRSRRRNRWQGSIRGSVDSKRNWSVGAGVTFRFGKRSVDWNGQHYTVVVRANPCNFNVYDENRDGVISKDEIQRIFGNNTSADELFLSLDMTTGNGRVEEDEFNFMAPTVIRGCDTDRVGVNP